MPTHKLQNRTEAEDLIRGLTYMGTGGGGRPDAGRDFLFSLIDRSQTPGWTDVEELPDDAWACTVFSMGTTAPRDPNFKEGQVWSAYGTRTPASALRRAIRELEAYSGKTMSAVFPLEIGAGNTSGPMNAAAQLGLQMVDGDGSARAVPEAGQCVPALLGIPMCPAAICDDWGNVLVMKNVTSLEVAEAIGKGMSVISKVPDPYTVCAVAAYLMPVSQLKKSIVLGTVSSAYALGQAVRHAREAGRDALATAAELMQGRILFRGIVSQRAWESKGGYQIGTTDIDGTGADAGHTLRIWFKNEHHISWRDGSPLVTSPDMLVVANTETAEPITNTYLAEGMPVTVIGAPAHPAFRTPEGIAVLGPKHFGFDLEYRSFEQLG